ncbi:Ctr domain-containing protein [Cephalotus follicularis]|uniref:Copper transport protein n=1 Tax=Cephalotus follicularis TaxID=3775 RepID=A0A1Q3CDM6_CEPFO|nr:Ctr domain-containing protein [Cephalotus follicularis]
MDDMPGMVMEPPSSTMEHPMMTMMHMTFFWGKNAEILFSGWPGTRTGMYVLALVFIFVLSLLVEWLSHCKLVKPGSNNLVAGVIQTFMHAIRVGLAYLVMLAVMSFNVGVLLVAIAGHGVGFFLFGSRAFKKTETVPYQKHTDLPPISC